MPASVSEAAAVIPSGAKAFFVKGTPSFINRPASLLNSYSKNHPD